MTKSEQFVLVILNYKFVISRQVCYKSVRRFAFEGEAAMGVVCCTLFRRATLGPGNVGPTTRASVAVAR